tara:strand:- start:177 stop:728 length:552 start_codon:yes stop_codon:yes gene_type:complete
MIHKTFTKKDLIEIIQAYDIPIDDPKQYNKNDLSITLTELLITEDFQIGFSPDYPDFFKNEDLTEYLSLPKSNEDLNYQEKSEMIQKAKKLINYARNGYMLSFTEYISHDDLYQDGIIVANHCDIPTCRRAIDELNKDPKIRNKIEKQITPKIKKKLDQKKINKEELQPRFKFRRGIYELNFD